VAKGELRGMDGASATLLTAGLLRATAFWWIFRAGIALIATSIIPSFAAASKCGDFAGLARKLNRAAGAGRAHAREKEK